MGETDHLQTLWDYLYLAHPLEKADLIIGFGSYDQSIPKRCAELYLQGWAPLVLFTGGFGKGTEGVFLKPEAELYAEVALQAGVPAERILVENRSTNTGENIRFTRELLAAKNLLPRRLIAVHKPYMSRRVWAALQKQWPEVEVVVAPGDPSLAHHLADMQAAGVPEKEIIDSLVGDVQRMALYADLGYQIPQPLPEEVRRAYEALVAQGYDRYVVKE